MISATPKPARAAGVSTIFGLLAVLLLSAPSAALASTPAAVISPLFVASAAPDDAFDEARRLAFAGEREAARALCREILAAKPSHHDARVLLGRVHAWDRQYDEAREQFLIVLRAKPDFADARVALVDTELWADNPGGALDALVDGLRRQPNSEKFLLRKARAERDLGRLSDAAVTLDQLLRVSPGDADAAKLMESVRQVGMRSKASLTYGFTDIDSFSNPWHQASFALGHRTSRGSVIVRANYANRFREDTAQYEIDAYPRLAKGLYAYVNYGYSSHRFFPKNRVGGELYANLPHGVELSGGFRWLQFESSEVTIYTGTIAKYQGNYWISLRPYITPKSEGTSQSYNLTVRRYFGGPDNYLGVTAGTGSSPGEITSTIDLARFDSRKVALRGQKAFGGLFMFKFSAGYSWEKLAFSRDRRQFNFGVGLERRF